MKIASHAKAPRYRNLYDGVHPGRKAGDEVASIFIMSQAGTDAGDVRTANTYANGMHTSVVSRKLVTGSKFDVQFSDMAARYGFGFAAFDNAQVRHVTSDDPMYLVFGKK
jgi:hypothetical protein